jgi:hypothetical protein
MRQRFKKKFVAQKEEAGIKALEADIKVPSQV